MAKAVDSESAMTKNFDIQVTESRQITECGDQYFHWKYCKDT